MKARASSAAALTGLLLAGLLLGGCGKTERKLPAEARLEGLYGKSAQLTLNGNVVDVRVTQSQSQLRRGGSLWAKVGPYIYLFSPQTEKLFEEYGGVAAVRVRTFDGSGNLVASAMLRRDALNGITWKHAIERVAKAREQGTQRPHYLEQLVEYGERLTTHQYSSRYVPGA